MEKGDFTAVLFSGGEATDNVLNGDIYNDDSNWPPGQFTPPPLENTNIERKYDLGLPIAVYPLIESAIRKGTGRTVTEHNKYISELFEGFSKVSFFSSFC